MSLPRSVVPSSEFIYIVNYGIVLGWFFIAATIFRAVFCIADTKCGALTLYLCCKYLGSTLDVGIRMEIKVNPIFRVPTRISANVPK